MLWRARVDAPGPTVRVTPPSDVTVARISPLRLQEFEIPSAIPKESSPSRTALDSTYTNVTLPADLTASSSIYEFFSRAFAFILGAAVGSFLNVCIYRLPVDLSINKPRRSFCPVCKAPIPWHQNVPLISWLLLRGRCANCRSRIAFRYFAVELLTALLFLAIWQSFPWQIAIAYCIFISFLIIGTFIDFEHFIIPDGVTIGGTIAGVLASVTVPVLMDTNSHLAAGVRSILAAALGYVILLIVLEAGKIAFGRKRIRFDAPTPFTWTKREDDADLVVGSEKSLWSDHFAREKDRLLLDCDAVKIDNHSYAGVTLEFHYDRVTVQGNMLELDHVTQISGVARGLLIPREAMGRGDLKFLAAIGAFLGWRAVLFSLFAGSLLGSIIGLITLIMGKRVWSAKLPFGPYLAFGAVSWMFFGDLFLRWYGTLLSP
jgi:leader peptidase (prepilin peptidase) / N-methyltransferase